MQSICSSITLIPRSWLTMMPFHWIRDAFREAPPEVTPKTTVRSTQESLPETAPKIWNPSMKNFYETIDFPAPQLSSTGAASNQKLNFLDLPGEICNQIFKEYYQHVRVNIGYCNQTQLSCKEQDLAKNHARLEQIYEDFAQARQELRDRVAVPCEGGTTSSNICSTGHHWPCPEYKSLFQHEMKVWRAELAYSKTASRFAEISADRFKLPAMARGRRYGLHMVSKQMYAETLSLRYASVVLNASGDCSRLLSRTQSTRPPHSLYSSLTRLTPAPLPCIRVLRLSVQVDAEPTPLRTAVASDRNSWEHVCRTAVECLPSLETLHVVLHIRGQGVRFTFKEHWYRSLLRFRECPKLAHTKVILRTDILTELQQQACRQEANVEKMRLHNTHAGRCQYFNTVWSTEACEEAHYEFAEAVAGKLLGRDDDQVLAKYIPAAEKARRQWNFDFCPQQISRTVI